MVINKVRVKKIFNDSGVQCPVSTLNIIDDILQRQIKNMVTRCLDGNVKRLTPELIWIALGNTNKKR
jgi:hypothetical protein